MTGLYSNRSQHNQKTWGKKKKKPHLKMSFAGRPIRQILLPSNCPNRSQVGQI